MMKLYLILSLLLSVVLCAQIIHIPLDERFTTRIAFINMAIFTPFKISSLPESYLPTLKKYPNATLINNWFSYSLSPYDMAIVSM